MGQSFSQFIITQDFRQNMWMFTCKIMGIIKTPAKLNIKDRPPSQAPAINYHFSRKCNYECGFCFHTAKSSDKLSLMDAKKLISQLAQAGFKKMNFAGGEPFLPDHTGKDNYLGEMVKHASEVGFESVSIISNARYIKEEWMEKYSQYLDMLGVSCDSADDTTNARIGRGKNGDHTKHIKRAAQLCEKYHIMFKLNTVVNKFNYNEDMTELVNEIKPSRWKIFQVLGVEGENNGRGAKTDVSEFFISDEQFTAYVQRHKESIAFPEIMKVEDNNTMQSSYVLVDEKGRFLDCSQGGKQPTKPILEVGVEQAWGEIVSSPGGGFDQQAFLRRGGVFDWTRSDRLSHQKNACCSSNSNSSGGGVDIEDLAGKIN